MLRIIFLTFGITLSLLANAKNSITNNDTINGTQKHAIYMGVGYGSNMLYSGYSLSDNKPYYSADILYSFNKRWSLAFMTYNLDATKPIVAFYDLALSYRRVFNSWFDAGATISSYFTAKSLQQQYFGNFSYISISTGFDWKLLYTKTIYSSIIDKNSSHSLQIKNSRYFYTNDFFNNKVFVDFNPSLNIFFGTNYQIISDNYSTSFGLRDLELSIPIAFNYAKTTFEVEPLYYIPIHKDPDFPSKKGVSLFINLYIKIL